MNFSKKLFYLPIIVIIAGLFISFFKESLGLAIVFIFAKFISPVISIISLIIILFIQKYKNKFSYYALILNILIYLIVSYLILHSLDNWKMLV